MKLIFDLDINQYRRARFIKDNDKIVTLKDGRLVAIPKAPHIQIQRVWYATFGIGHRLILEGNREEIMQDKYIPTYWYILIGDIRYEPRREWLEERVSPNVFETNDSLSWSGSVV